MDINLDNYEEYLLSYIDGELNEEETAAVRRFLRAHPDKQKELELLQMTVLPAEEAIVFPDKQSLCREEKLQKRKVYFLQRYAWPVAAAAAGVALLMFFYQQSHKTMPPPSVVINNTTQTKQQSVTPLSEKQKDQPAEAVSGKEQKKEISPKENKPAALAKTERKSTDTPRQKGNRLPAITPPNVKENGAIATNHALPSLPALPSAEIAPAEVSPNASLTEVPSEMMAASEINAEKEAGKLALNNTSTRNTSRENKLLNATKTVALAKQNMDSTITQKLTDINQKASGFINNIAKNGIKIGHITFAFNN